MLFKDLKKALVGHENRLTFSTTFDAIPSVYMIPWDKITDDTIVEICYVWHYWGMSKSEIEAIDQIVATHNFDKFMEFRNKLEQQDPDYVGMLPKYAYVHFPELADDETSWLGELYILTRETFNLIEMQDPERG